MVMSSYGKEERQSGIRRTIAVPVVSPTAELAAGKRTPFAWPVFAVKSKASQKPAVLEWPGHLPEHEPAWLRLTIALEVWEDAELEVFLAQSKRVIGRLELHYCDVFEVTELALSAGDAACAQQEGIGLWLTEGAGPLYLFGGDRAEAAANDDAADSPAADSGPVDSGSTDLISQGVPDVFRPHLMRADSGVNRYEQYLSRLRSLASLQQFGWKEGCVLDGLFDLDAVYPARSFRGTIERHLRQFIDDKQQLRYEDPWGNITDGRIYGIEGTLPFAVMALVWPDHPALKLMTDYYKAGMREDGALYDEGMVSAEGNYTIAYPLAVVARLLGSKELEDTAIRQLRIRQQALTEGSDLYLRCYESGGRTFRNWIRAYTWYMLGLARTLHLLQHRKDIDDLKNEFRRVAEIVLSHQQPDGLWRVFVDDPGVIADTSGSAGIAAALSLGVRNGLLPSTVLERTQRTLAALQQYLTPDGLLGGVSQANKNGEAMQRSSYRVLSQMGMGLKAQLIAAQDAQLLTENRKED